MSAARHCALGVAALVIIAVGLQVLLYAPSFVGAKLFAPTDVLLNSGAIGSAPEHSNYTAHNDLLWDPVQVFYPWLDFAAREVRAGRIPLWNPHAFCGSPFLANNQSAVFSPFSAIYYLWTDPRSLIWIQLAKVLVAALGTYGFLRELGRSRFASAIAGASFPLSGFFVAWASYPLTSTAAWLPWAFWAVERLVRQPGVRSGAGFSVALALMLLSGHLETAAHVLVSVAFYAAWRWFESYRRRPFSRDAISSCAAGIASGVLGFGLAAVQLLPTQEYLESSRRLATRRWGGIEQRTPRDDLVRIVFPYLKGTQQRGSRELTATNFHEGATNGYIGFCMLIALAPLGLTGGWRESSVWCWVILGLSSAAPAFDLPILSWWGRAPPFDLMRNNRMLLVTAWTALVMAARGLDSLDQKRPAQTWAAIAAGVVAAICAATVGSVAFSEPTKLIAQTTPESWPWFRHHWMMHALVAASTSALLTAWLLRDRFRQFATSRFNRASRIAFGSLALSELVVFAHGYNPMVESSTFYPRREFIQFLQQHARLDRVCGFRFTLPPNIAMKYGLRDVRGYDAVDPLPQVELFEAANPRWQPDQPYAATLSFSGDASPALNLMGARYIVTAQRLNVSSWPLVAQANEVFIYENPQALPRAYVPRRAVSVPLASDRLAVLRNPAFDPRDTVMLSELITMPATLGSGDVELTEHEPTRIELRVQLDGDSIVVLNDAWSPGWQVTVDGVAARPLQVNHGMRGVLVSAGEHVVEWRYRPASWRRGYISSLGSAAVLVGWIVISGIYRLYGSTTPVTNEAA